MSATISTETSVETHAVPLSVIALLSLVMGEVGAVTKDSRNTQQNFNFRGIDAVVNAVYPALVRHGVIVVPNVTSITYENVEVGQKRTAMVSCRVRVVYDFYGPAGDRIQAAVAAEAMDAGDKATPKAMSVAMRTALLQTLCLPTDEPDPDSQTYERAPALTDTEIGKRLLTAAQKFDVDVQTLTAKYRKANGDIDMATFNLLPVETRTEFLLDVERYAQRLKQQESR